MKSQADLEAHIAELSARVMELTSERDALEKKLRDTKKAHADEMFVVCRNNPARPCAYPECGHAFVEHHEHSEASWICNLCMYPTVTHRFVEPYPEKSDGRS
jgi:hypothetical protein